MPRCLYLTPDGEEKLVWLDDRSADAIARMVDATRQQEPGRARAASILGSPAWQMPSGILAMHALAISAVHVCTSLISIGPDRSLASTDLDLITELAAELQPLAIELDTAPLAAFDKVGVVHQLPDGHGVCASTHAAVRAVFADVKRRLEPILTELGLLTDSESPSAIADRVRPHWPELLVRLQGQVVDHYYVSLVRRWEGWFSCERMLVAEVAAAGKAGLIPAEGGQPLDQKRFDAAIDQVLNTQGESARQYLFSRWRLLAMGLRYLRATAERLPSLQPEHQLLEGLGKLTTEVLAHTQDAKAEAPGLLELLDVLRELTMLRVREGLIFDRGDAPCLDTDFCAELRPILTDVLPRVLRAATTDVDALTLRPAPTSSRTAGQAVVSGTTEDARSRNSAQDAELNAGQKPPARSRPPRRLSIDELARHRARLVQLAADFDRCTQDLRSRPENELLLPEMRKAMSQAGRTLLLLLHHGVVEPPSSMPPWLSWRNRSTPRPYFCKSYLPPLQGQWSPPRRVRGLVQVLVAGPSVANAHALQHEGEDSVPRFLHRHVFIEAVAGWLGHRAQPGVRIVVPKHAVVIGEQLPPSLADEDRVPVVFDWVESPPHQRLLFLDLGAACAVACRYLVEVLARLLPTHEADRQPSVTQQGADVGRTSLPTEPNDDARPRRGREREPGKRQAARAVPVDERDACALKTAQEWDESGRDWTLTDLATELGCDRTQLTGRTSKGGPKRCPMFSVYWEAKQRELQQRQMNLRSTNRTAGSSDG